MTTTLPLPTQLYHYTSVRGVEGILTGKAVWASLLHFMNDSREWLYALDLVEKALLKKFVFRTDRYWLPFIAELSKSLSAIEGLNICVFSLTAMPNQLSQWRGYCPAEGGYNLSFQPQLLQQHLDRHNFTLRQCIYDWNEEQKAIDQIVNDVLAAVGTLRDKSEIDNLGVIGESLGGIMRLDAYCEGRKSGLSKTKGPSFLNHGLKTPSHRVILQCLSSSC